MDDNRWKAKGGRRGGGRMRRTRRKIDGWKKEGGQRFGGQKS
jgi:hypothetical protein